MMITKSSSRLQQLIRSILIIYYWFIITASVITLSEKLNWDSKIASEIAFILLIISVLIFIGNIFWYQKGNKIVYAKKPNSDLKKIIKRNLWIVVITSGFLLGTYYFKTQNHKLEYFALLSSLGLIPIISFSFVKMVKSKIIINARE